MIYMPLHTKAASLWRGLDNSCETLFSHLRGKPQMTTLEIKSCHLLTFGGPEGDRTLDLLNAIQARSQLRHGPVFWNLYSVFDTTHLSPRLGRFNT